MRLDKNRAVFERDETGKLKAVERVLETLEDKPTVLITPMFVHEWDKLSIEWVTTKTQTETEVDIIQKHCIEPTFTIDEIKALRPKFKIALINAIVSETVGMSQTDLTKAGEDIEKKYLSQQVQNQ